VVSLWHFHISMCYTSIWFIPSIVPTPTPFSFLGWLQQVSVFHIHPCVESTSTIFTLLYPLALVSNNLTFGIMFCIYMYVYMIMLVFELDLSPICERKYVTLVFLNITNFIFALFFWKGLAFLSRTDPRRIRPWSSYLCLLQIWDDRCEPPYLACTLRWSLANSLPMTLSNSDVPYLCLLSSWDY
jgi:hypothetical protein